MKTISRERLKYDGMEDAVGEAAKSPYQALWSRRA